MPASRIDNRQSRRGKKDTSIQKDTRIVGPPMAEHIQHRTGLEVRQRAAMQVHDSGDHYIIVGEVVNHECSEGKPLLFYGGSYGALDNTSAAAP